MEQIIEIEGKKFVVLNILPEHAAVPSAVHLRRNDGKIFIVDEIKDAVFEDIVEPPPIKFDAPMINTLEPTPTNMV